MDTPRDEREVEVAMLRAHVQRLEKMNKQLHDELLAVREQLQFEERTRTFQTETADKMREILRETPPAIGAENTVTAECFIRAMQEVMVSKEIITQMNAHCRELEYELARYHHERKK